jgi:hypothetical protein
MSLRSVIRSAVGDNERPGRSSFYSLSGLFVCDGCDLRLAPLDLVDGGRGYRSACGCRIWPVDAEVVERLTRDAAEHRNRLQVADVPASELGPVFRRLLCEVRVGAVEHELTFLWRT